MNREYLIILLLGGMLFSSYGDELDNDLRVVRIRELVSENVLANKAPSGILNPVTHSNEYRKTIYYPGARIAGRTVFSINLDTHTVELTDGTNNLRLIVMPGISTNRMADITSLSTRMLQRVAAGDRLSDGSIVYDITADDAVVVESASTVRRLVPWLTEDERQQLLKRKPD